MSNIVEEKAIVLIEFQNEWLDERGKLNFLIRDQLKERDVIRKTMHLIENARERGVTVIHVPLIYTQDYREVDKQATGLLSVIRENRRFQKGSLGAKFYPSFVPKEGDIVAVGRKGVSAFAGSDLEFILRSKNIKEIFFAGFVTEVCVLTTLLDAYNRGYKCTLLSDCTVGHTPEDQEYVENLVKTHYGNVLGNEQLTL